MGNWGSDTPVGGVTTLLIAGSGAHLLPPIPGTHGTMFDTEYEPSS